MIQFVFVWVYVTLYDSLWLCITLYEPKAISDNYLNYFQKIHRIAEVNEAVISLIY